jgi:MATE family multidrug resistance protein
VARLGTEQLAAHVLALRIISVSFLPGEAIGQAAGVLTGQAFGARDVPGVRRAFLVSVRIAMAIMGSCGLAFVLLPHLLIAPFGVAPTVEAYAVQLLMVCAVFQIFDALAEVWEASLCGVGDTRFVLVLGIAESWAVRLPLGYALGFLAGMGVAGVYWGLTGGIVIRGSIAATRILGTGWRRAPEPAIAVLT